MIDAHAHVISADISRYPPGAPSGEINPDYFDNPMTIERLLSEMDSAGVQKAVLVQRGSIYGYDSSYVCDSASRFPDRLVAVCSIDATNPDCAKDVQHWIVERQASGIRLMELLKGTDISWLDSPLAREAWKAAAELNAPVCVHFFPWNRVEGFHRLHSILSDIPGLTVVIDHLGAINSDAEGPDYGVDELLESVAGFDGVNIKFTTIPLGRLKQAGKDPKPIIRRVLDLFGSERMMWGSDITQSAGSYDYMVEIGREAVGMLSSNQQDHILSGTTMRVYGQRWI